MIARAVPAVLLVVLAGAPSASAKAPVAQSVGSTAIALHSPKRATAGVQSIAAHLGIKTYDGRRRDLRGKHAPRGFYLYSQEIPVLARMARGAPLPFSDYAQMLADNGVRTSSDGLLARYRKRYGKAGAGGFTGGLFRTMGLKFVAGVQLTRLQEWLLFVDNFVKRPQGHGARAAQAPGDVGTWPSPADQWPHVLLMFLSLDVQLAPEISSIHQGAGGAGETQILTTGVHLFPALVYTQPFAFGPLAGLALRGNPLYVQGAFVNWNVVGSPSDVGDIDLAQSKPVTDWTGASSIVYQAAADPGDPSQAEVTHVVAATAQISASQALQQVYVMPPQLSALTTALPDIRRAGVISVIGHAPKPKPPPATVAGSWNGTWASSQNPQSGTFHAEFAVDGAGALTGTVSVAGSHCISGGTATGTVSGNHVTFGNLAAEWSIGFVGDLSGDSMSGTWTGNGCNEPDAGTWQATR